MRLTGLLLALMLLFPTFLQAKSPEQVKSAFLFQIAKFVEFPKVNNKQAVTFCFYDVEHGIGELLKDNSNLKINDIPIETVLINKKQQISDIIGIYIGRTILLFKTVVISFFVFFLQNTLPKSIDPYRH